MNRLLSSSLAVLALAGTLGLAGCGKPNDATAENFTAAMNSYLAQRGDLCVGKAKWPIDLTQREIDAGARNALQMPVLEKLGLVASTVEEVDVTDEDGQSHHMKVRRYALTDAGNKSYIQRTSTRPDGTKSASADLCAAKLTLDKVVAWAATPAPGDKNMIVTYTYKAEPAAWMNDPEAQKVFPVVANVLHGAGNAHLTETFRPTDSGWIAVDL